MGRCRALAEPFGAGKKDTRAFVDVAGAGLSQGLFLGLGFRV